MGVPPVRLLEERLAPAAGRRLRAVERGECLVLQAELPGRARAAFTTRRGGVSPAPYDHLNLSAKTGDDGKRVRENRARLARALDLPGRFVVPRQVHGTRVVGAAEYREAEEAGGGPDPGGGGDPAGPEADGLVLQSDLDARLVPLLLFADCLPVILVGEVDMAVVHAGWRGLLAGVIQQGARSMTGPPALALIGPSIGPCCYEVDGGVGRQFARRYGPEVFRDGRLDLWAAAERALGEVGLAPAQVVNPRLCTHCLPDLFYSHRRDGGVTGRQGALAWYRPEAA